MHADAYCVCADRLGDVLELPLAAVLETDVELAFDLAENLFRNQDGARIGDALQPDSNVGPVAVKVAVLPDDNITKIEPDAQLQGTVGRGEMILYLNPIGCPPAGQQCWSRRRKGRRPARR